MVKHTTSAVEKSIPIIVGGTEKPKKAKEHGHFY